MLKLYKHFPIYMSLISFFLSSSYAVAQDSDKEVHNFPTEKKAEILSEDKDLKTPDIDMIMRDHKKGKDPVGKSECNFPPCDEKEKF